MSDPRPLDGVVVLDLTRLLPGAWCSMVLADFGADVLKVEQPGTGDYSRWAPPRYREESVYFQGVNRNKRSLTLDLGQAAVSLLERKFWENLCRYAGRPDLIDPAETADQRITDHGSRGEAYAQFLEELFARKPRDAWIAELQAKDVPCCPVYAVEEALADPHVVARGMLAWVAHPTDGRIPQLANPLHPSHGAPRIERPAPRLGEHTEEVLRGLSYTEADIARLRRDGVV